MGYKDLEVVETIASGADITIELDASNGESAPDSAVNIDYISFSSSPTPPQPGEAPTDIGAGDGRAGPLRVLFFPPSA